MVLEIDEDKRRISLGMKQCKANPWEEFAANVQRGDRVKGPIKSITDFGVFVGLAAGIDGLVHLSDLSWNEAGEAAVRNYKKGQEVEAIVLAVDVDRERISLGIKQLDSDPFTSFTSVNDRGAIVTGKVKTVDARGAEIQLNDDVTGYLRASEISRDRVEDARNVLKEGDEVSADDHQRRPQDALDPAVDQGQGQRRRPGSHAAPARRRASARTPARRAWARCCAPSSTTRASKRRAARAAPAAQRPLASGSTAYPSASAHDPLGPRRPAGRALRPADPPRHRVRGQDDPRRDGRRARARASHRDPRLRQLLDQPPAAARRPQPALGRAGRDLGKAGARTSSRARRCARRSISASARCARSPKPTPQSSRTRPARPNNSRGCPRRCERSSGSSAPRSSSRCSRSRSTTSTRRRCAGSSATSGARRWSSSCSPRSGSAARSASSRWCRAGGVIAGWRATARVAPRIASAPAPTVPPPSDAVPLHPPRDGL